MNRGLQLPGKGRRVLQNETLDNRDHPPGPGDKDEQPGRKVTIFQISIRKRNLRKKESRHEPETAAFAVISNRQAPLCLLHRRVCSRGQRTVTFSEESVRASAFHRRGNRGSKGGHDLMTITLVIVLLQIQDLFGSTFGIHSTVTPDFRIVPPDPFPRRPEYQNSVM